MLAIELQYVVDGIAEADKGGDDRAGARAKDETERLAEFSASKALNLLENAERVESFSPATVEA